MPARWLSTPVLIVLLALPLAARGQTPPATTPGPFAVGALDGLERAVMRTYAVDVAGLAAASSTPDSGTHAPEGLVFVHGTIFEFATPEQATAAIPAVEQQIADELTDDGDGDLRFTLRATNIPDLGDEATRFDGTEAGPRATLAGYLVRDGAWLYLALVVATDDTAEPAARAMVDFALAQDAGADAGEYHADGSSSGGLWAKLPTADDIGDDGVDALQGVTPVVDTILAPAGTP